MEIYPVVPVTQEEFNDWCEPWNYALILTVLGRRFNLFFLKEELRKMWGFQEYDFEIIDLPNNYFVVRFRNEEFWQQHYKKVLCDGPWVIRQHCVLIQRWSPYFNAYQNPLGRVATWVRIPDIPMHYYNSHYISRFGDKIGRTLKVDMKTLNDFQSTNSKIKRGKYVRICVELNLQKKFVPKIISIGSVYNVEYEGLGLICFACGRFEHRREACPYKCSTNTQNNEVNSAASPVVSPTRAPVKPTKSSDKEEEQFGPWIINQRVNRARFSKKVEPRGGQRSHVGPDASTRKEATFGQKSRFAVIEDLDEEGDVKTTLSSEKKLEMDQSRRQEKALTIRENGRDKQMKVNLAGLSKKETGKMKVSKSRVEYRATGKENKRPQYRPNSESVPGTKSLSDPANNKLDMAGVSDEGQDQLKNQNGNGPDKGLGNLVNNEKAIVPEKRSKG
ncbi:uncharacterized protein LOC114722336 [Neltuma alba]|uniref:uncharacterized protein LOC114722336 n=1 Tax=Neltuma alba TaxID=207710 RepID=UPI0010A2D125|nr:uncharacterized protein LOC114722336 [Prosopis alba]